VAPGIYQLRVLANDGFTLLAATNTVAVTSGGQVLAGRSPKQQRIPTVSGGFPKELR
jgi:hypothetical protein